MMQEILIESVRTDGGTQSREKINEEHVAELCEALKSGKRLPPITVYHDGTDHWCADGFHRVMAHSREGKRTIRCDVKKGTKNDAIWASVGANSDHGLKRTNADKQKAVRMALAQKPDASSRVIAEHVGVSHTFVDSARRQVATVATCPTENPNKRQGLDGKEYPARRIPPPPGNPPKPRIPPPPMTPREVETAAEIKNAWDKAEKSTPPQPKTARLDGVKKPIPDHLLPLFDRGQEIQDILSDLSRIRGMLKRAEENGDPLFAEVNFNGVLAELQNVYAGIKSSAPYAVCPWCHGVITKGCRGCGGRGAIGEYRYNTTVPKELK
jgi:hypothetical protein